jgi:hypothetical protein
MPTEAYAHGGLCPRRPREHLMLLRKAIVAKSLELRKSGGKPHVADRLWRMRHYVQRRVRSRLDAPDAIGTQYVQAHLTSCDRL